MQGCVVLVVGMLSTVTTAMDGLQTSVGELQALKDLNGVAQCATSPPNTTVTARSKIDCMRVCLSYGSSCAHGANYHSDSKTCGAVFSTTIQPSTSTQLHLLSGSDLIFSELLVKILTKDIRFNDPVS